MLRSKMGSQWLNPILLAPLWGQKRDIAFCSDKCEISSTAEHELHPHNWENSSCLMVWLKTQEWRQNIRRNPGHLLGLRKQNGAEGSLSLLPRLSSRQECSAVLRSSLIHGLTGLTLMPHQSCSLRKFFCYQRGKTYQLRMNLNLPQQWSLILK